MAAEFSRCFNPRIPQRPWELAKKSEKTWFPRRTRTATCQRPVRAASARAALVSTKPLASRQGGVHSGFLPLSMLSWPKTLKIIVDDWSPVFGSNTKSAMQMVFLTPSAGVSCRCQDDGNMSREFSWEANLHWKDVGSDFFQQRLPGWWFGTWILLFHILGIVTPTDFHIFQRVAQPPTSYIFLWCRSTSHGWSCTFGCSTISWDASQTVHHWSNPYG